MCLNCLGTKTWRLLQPGWQHPARQGGSEGLGRDGRAPGSVHAFCHQPWPREDGSHGVSSLWHPKFPWRSLGRSSGSKQCSPTSPHCCPGNLALKEGSALRAAVRRTGQVTSHGKYTLLTPLGMHLSLVPSNCLCVGWEELGGGVGKHHPPSARHLQWDGDPGGGCQSWPGASQCLRVSVWDVGSGLSFVF